MSDNQVLKNVVLYT